MTETRDDKIEKIISIRRRLSKDCYNNKFIDTTAWDTYTDDAVSNAYTQELENLNNANEKAKSGIADAILNAWRYKPLCNTLLRSKYPLIPLIISAVYTSGESVPEPLRGAVGDLLGFKPDITQHTGDVSSYHTGQMLEDVYNSLPSVKHYVPGEVLVDSFLRDISDSELKTYSQNAYEAALDIFYITHPELRQELEKEADALQTGDATPDDNDKATILHNPTFREFFGDKLHVWKELNITPITARIGLLTGKGLKPNEAQRLIDDINLMQTGADKLLKDTYRRDVKDRIYTERVLARSAEKKSIGKPTATASVPTAESVLQNPDITENLPTKKTSGLGMLVFIIILALLGWVITQSILGAFLLGFSGILISSLILFKSDDKH